ncbi:MAG: hypothetical protein ABGX05_02825 [Pirellulaceae bacterium]
MRPYLRPGILVLYSLLTCTVFAQGPEPLRTWKTREQAGDWTGTRFTASTTNQVHILKGGKLHSIDLASLAVTQDQKDWTTTQWMCAWGNRLYLFDGQAHHRVTPTTFETTLVSQPKTP